MTSTEDLLRLAVARANPKDESSPVTLPSGEVVTFGQLVALTNGEAISWMKYPQ